MTTEAPPVARLRDPDQLSRSVPQPVGDWARQGLCYADKNPLWIKGPRVSTRPHQVELADEICGRCPVRGECRAWAASGTAFEGVAGGLIWPSGGMCGGQAGGRGDKWCAACRGHRKHGHS